MQYTVKKQITTANHNVHHSETFILKSVEASEPDMGSIDSFPIDRITLKYTTNNAIFVKKIIFDLC